MLSASQLRLGFLAIFVLIMMISWKVLWPWSRAYGFFYSIPERQIMWQKLPDPSALATLRAIYHEGPYAEMLTYMQSPTQPTPGYTALQQRPEYRAALDRIHRAALESELRKLRQGWYYSRFESLMQLSHQTRDLNPDQLKLLLNMRKQVVEGILESIPTSDPQTEILCVRLSGTWKAHPPLPQEWSKAILRQSRETSSKLVARFSQSSPDERLEIMRCLRLQVCVAPLAAAQRHLLETSLQSGSNGNQDNTRHILTHVSRLGP